MQESTKKNQLGELELHESMSSDTSLTLLKEVMIQDRFAITVFRLTVD